MDITTATPAQIDTQLAAYYDQEVQAQSARDSARTGILRQLYGYATRRTLRHLTDEDLNTFRAKIEASASYSSRYGHYLTSIAAAKECLVEIEAAEAPLHAEYARRPWSRFFIVSGGHIHSSMNCSTCNRGGQSTRFGWLPELSGKAEADAVKAEGALLCTVCFPTAPTEWTNQRELDEQAKAAAYCAGSGTMDWKGGKVRTGFAAGNGGYCSRCGGWAGTTSKMNHRIRKHKPAVQGK